MIATHMSAIFVCSCDVFAFDFRLKIKYLKEFPFAFKSISIGRVGITKYSRPRFSARGFMGIGTVSVGRRTLVDGQI